MSTNDYILNLLNIKDKKENQEKSRKLIIKLLRLFVHIIPILAQFVVVLIILPTILLNGVLEKTVKLKYQIFPIVNV